MALMLKPFSGKEWLDVEEVINRLRSEFRRVEVKPGGAVQYAESLAKSYRQSGHADVADRVEAVKDKGAAVAVIEGTPDQALILMLLPNVPIMAGFHSDEHLQMIQPLLQRCTAALGYELR